MIQMEMWWWRLPKHFPIIKYFNEKKKKIAVYYSLGVNLPPRPYQISMVPFDTTIITGGSSKKRNSQREFQKLYCKLPLLVTIRTLIVRSSNRYLDRWYFEPPPRAMVSFETPRHRERWSFEPPTRAIVFGTTTSSNGLSICRRELQFSELPL